MREIKFRAWDKDNKEMLKVKSIHFSESGDCIVVNPFDFISFKFIELMQYTGLKDKNGVEIYEGDIVKLLFCRDAYVDHYGEFHDPVGSVNIEVVKMEDFCICPLYADYQTIEVIGNRYENTELLELQG